MNISTYERRIEREFLRLGKQLAKPIHDRVKFLTESLKPAFPITGLRMGMGVYIFLGSNFSATFSGDSTGDAEMRNLFDSLEHNKVWRPDALTPRHEKTLRELKELLDYLTDAPYLPLLEFGDEPR